MRIAHCPLRLFSLLIAHCWLALLLRDSEYKGTLGWDAVRDMAKGTMTYDRDGWRAEMVSLIEKSRRLTGDPTHPTTK